MAGVAKRDGKKESKWRCHVAGQVTGGLPVRAYCRAQGLSENSFYWWRRELQRRDQEKSAAAGVPAFVPVRVTADSTEAPAVAVASVVEIVLPGDRRLRVTGKVDRQQLADVLDVLERAVWGKSGKETAGC